MNCDICVLVVGQQHCRTSCTVCCCEHSQGGYFIALISCVYFTARVACLYVCTLRMCAALVWTTRSKRLHGEKLGLAGQTIGVYDGVVFCAWACAGLLSLCMLPQHRERGHRTNHDCGSDPLCHVRRPVYSGGERDRCHLPLHRG